MRKILTVGLVAVLFVVCQHGKFPEVEGGIDENPTVAVEKR